MLKKMQYKDIYTSLEKDLYFKNNPARYKSPDRRFHISWIKNNVDIIDRFVDTSFNKKHLYDIKQLLVHVSKNKFICYTDGSVKNIGDVNASLTFG
jgi:hypothetical protein